MLSDRVALMSRGPGHIKDVITIQFPPAAAVRTWLPRRNTACKVCPHLGLDTRRITSATLKEMNSGMRVRYIVTA